MNKISTEFKVIGYFEEYFVDGKFIGSKKCNKQPNRNLGWWGRQEGFAGVELV